MVISQSQKSSDLKYKQFSSVDNNDNKNKIELIIIGNYWTQGFAVSIRFGITFPL